MRRSENKTNKKLSRSGLNRFLLTSILVILIVVAWIITKSRSYDRLEIAEKDVKIEELKRKIEIEEEKTKDLKKKQDGAMYEDYIEDLARSELGLIKDDEIILKPQN